MGAALLAALLQNTYAQTQTAPAFAVSRYAVEGDNPLSASATQAVLASYTGEGVTMERVQAAAAALEQALKDRGYAFLRVIVPPHDARGVVTLRVLSFKVNAVNVSGNKYFDTDNVRRSLPSIKSGVTPNMLEIARELALANDQGSKQVEVGVARGTAPDTVDVSVKVDDSKPLQFFANLDNSGNKQTGHTRLGIGVQHSNLFNRDHSITATYTTSPDGHTSDIKQYGFFYRAPFYTLNGALSAYYTKSDANSGVVANFFNVSGGGEFYGLRWTHRLVPIGSYSHTAEVGLENRYFENNVTFLGTPIGTNVRSRPLLLRYTGRLDGAALVVRGSVEYAHNLQSGGNNDDAFTDGHCLDA